MNRAIIIGATGAVGTALVAELIHRGIETLVLCREDSKRNSQIPKHPLVKMKYCSLQELSKLENDTGKTYDVFYHFGWDGTFGNTRNDMKRQNLNVGYALDAVDTAKRFGCHTFIGAGSQAEYGRVEGLLKPDTPTFPENGYGMAKLCAGQMTREHAHQLGMRHIWVRILSIYGPNDGSETMVMSTVNKLMAGEIPQFTKGEQMWDYLFSGDAARAFAEMAWRGVDGKVYVLGGGNARPLKDYMTDIRDVVSPKSELAIGAIPYPAKQVMYLCADVSDLEQDLGWTARTNFKDGIKTLFAYQNINKNGADR